MTWFGMRFISAEFENRSANGVLDGFEVILQVRLTIVLRAKYCPLDK